MSTATLKNHTLITSSYGSVFRKSIAGPGLYQVRYMSPARVGYEGKFGTVQVTQADLDNQPVDLEIVNER